jgi:predicted ABC-type transport system involved in lysophospholipase L1 biosynthesis ATPase subunit
LPLQRADHATERLGGAQQQRVVVAGVIVALPRGKHLAVLGHSKLLLMGPVAHSGS